MNEFSLRHHCDTLLQIIYYFDRSDLPQELHDSLLTFAELLEQYVADGYCYKVVGGGEQDVDFIFSDPNKVNN